MIKNLFASVATTLIVAAIMYLIGWYITLDSAWIMSSTSGRTIFAFINLWVIVYLIANDDKQQQMRLQPAAPQPKPEPRQRGKEKDGDEAFYAKIWAERPHVCEETGIILPSYKADSPKFTFQIRFHCAHILPKKLWPKFRHDPRNIVLLTIEHHNAMDNNPRYQRNMKIWPMLKERIIDMLGFLPNEEKFDNKDDKKVRA